jgi:hypothetical protein
MNYSLSNKRKAMNKKIIIFIFLTPCYTQSKIDDWKPSNTGLNAAKELRKSAREVVLGAGALVASIFVAPKAYNAAKDTISPPPEVRVQSEATKVRDCFQGHAADQDLTIHNYPVACRQHLIGFILARDAVETQGGNLNTVPRAQDIIDEFQHYRRQS